MLNIRLALAGACVCTNRWSLPVIRALFSSCKFYTLNYGHGAIIQHSKVEFSFSSIGQCMKFSVKFTRMRAFTLIWVRDYHVWSARPRPTILYTRPTVVNEAMEHGGCPDIPVLARNIYQTCLSSCIAVMQIEEDISRRFVAEQGFYPSRRHIWPTAM